MINNVTITNSAGDELTLELRSPEQSGFFIQSIEGLGPGKADVNITETPTKDGGIFNSSRINSRNIVFDLGFYNDGSETIETIRQKTYRYFPMNEALTILIEADNRTVYATGYVESNEPKIFDKDTSTIISIICPDPFFYGDQVVQTLFSGVVPSFEFPFENPSTTLPLIQFGTVQIATEKSVYYEGEISTGIMIYITVLGDVVTLGVHDLTSGKSMQLDATRIPAITGNKFILNDQIIFSTIKGQKYVHLIRNGVTYNILNAMFQGVGSWFVIYRGDNLFTYTSNAPLDRLQFMFEHRNVYGGV